MSIGIFLHTIAYRLQICKWSFCYIGDDPTRESFFPCRQPHLFRQRWKYIWLLSIRRLSTLFIAQQTPVTTTYSETVSKVWRQWLRSMTDPKFQLFNKPTTLIFDWLTKITWDSHQEQHSNIFFRHLHFRQQQPRSDINGQRYLTLEPTVKQLSLESE